MQQRFHWDGFVAIVLAAVFASGCATVRVDTDYSPDTDFSVLQSYMWLDWKPTGNPRIDDGLLHDRVRRAADVEFAAKGFTPNASAPDFWVIEHFVIERHVDVGTYAEPYGYRRGPVYAETYVREYELGTVMLDIVDANTKKLLWRGSGEAQVHENLTPEERVQRVNLVVEKVLASFPPGRDS